MVILAKSEPVKEVLPEEGKEAEEGEGGEEEGSEDEWLIRCKFAINCAFNNYHIQLNIK